MANFFDKLSSVFKDINLTASDEKQLKELCYIGNLEYLKAQNTRFILPVGIIISKYVIMGKNCVIYQNVTIGDKDFFPAGNAAGYPQIGDNTIIYSGAFILGPVKIGKNCVIGANSVVVCDVPDDSIVGGNPASIVPRV